MCGLLNEELKKNYGVTELNPIDRGMQDEFLRCGDIPSVGWGDPRLSHIVRFRLLVDRSYPGHSFADVSYCWGRLKNGDPCNVSLPFYQIPNFRKWKTFIISEARSCKVYAKGLRIFENASILYD